MLIPALFFWTHLPLTELLPYFLLGPIAISAQYLVVIGYRIADVSILTPMDYSWLVFAALIGYVFFGELPTPGVIIGSGMIIVGGTLLTTLRVTKI